MQNTIEEAVKNVDDWCIIAKLVTKWIYNHKINGESKPLLTLLFIDAKGTTIELRTWKRLKAYCVYRKVRRDETYEIDGSGIIREPNGKFSTSDADTTAYWYINPTDIELVPKKCFKVVANIEKARKVLSNKEPVNILGVYAGHTKGTMNHPNVQGYFVKLVDEAGYMFNVLVWHNVRIEKTKFPLFNCEKGDTILVPSARLTNFATKEQGLMLTLTTTVSPVVESECVFRRFKDDLKRNVKLVGGPRPIKSWDL